MQELLVFIKHSSLGVLASFLSILILLPLAPKLGLVDHPGGRKTHIKATPLIGGLSIFLGLSTTFLMQAHLIHQLKGIWIAAGFLLFIGLLDDVLEINSKIRLVAQIISTYIAIYTTQTYLNYIGTPFFTDIQELDSLSVFMTIFVTISFINAINMLDGLDGLAGGVILGQTLLLLCISLYLKETIISQLLVSLILLIVLFLLFNAPFPWRKHAYIFLGDSGSTLLALFVAWTGLYLSQAMSALSMMKPVTIIWCLGLPFMDIVSVCFFRKRSGKSCLTPGHDHIHHILLQLGLSKNITVVSVSLFSFALGVVGLIMAWLEVHESYQFAGFLLLVSVYIITLSKCIKFSRSSNDKLLPSILMNE